MKRKKCRFFHNWCVLKVADAKYLFTTVGKDDNVSYSCYQEITNGYRRFYLKTKRRYKRLRRLRICLRCKTYDNKITPAIEQISAEWEIEKKRILAAIEIAKENNL
jgi:hypothetical protein